jgi:hypothetical protein
MAKRPLASVANDFKGVIDFLEDRAVIPASPTTELLATAKRLHKATYSLILWRFRLKNLPPHGQVFIEEIASDALQILPQALMGYGKSTKLLTRGVIENTLRHVYFSDHPVEFMRTNIEGNFFLTITELFEYLTNHPDLCQAESQFNAITRLRSLYKELSAGVHGKKVQDLEMRISLNKISFNQVSFEEHKKIVERCAEACNFLIAAFHRQQMRAFEKEDRQIILSTMRAQARQVWTALA